MFQIQLLNIQSLEKVTVIKVRKTQKIYYLLNTKSCLASRVARTSCTSTNNYSYNK